MADQENTAEETTEQAGQTKPTVPTETAPFTAERVLDVVLGAAALAADEVVRTARQLRDDAPAITAAWEEKGRPLREQLYQKISGAADRSSAPTEAKPPADDATKTTGVASMGSADDEISVLERRVRELEEQVAFGGTTPEVHTTAEESTFVPGDELPPSTLADSPYAVSETEEEVAREAHSEHPQGESAIWFQP